jgi:hypothetical protein
MRKHEKERIKAIHKRQKEARTVKNAHINARTLMVPVDGKTTSEVAAEAVQKLSTRHLEYIANNPEEFEFEFLEPEGLARFAEDELILRSLTIVRT